jgi:hypothetical protein
MFCVYGFVAVNFHFQFATNMESNSSPVEEATKLVNDLLAWLEEDKQSEEYDCCQCMTADEEAVGSDDNKDQWQNPVSLLYGM